MPSIALISCHAIYLKNKKLISNKLYSETSVFKVQKNEPFNVFANYLPRYKLYPPTAVGSRLAMVLKSRFSLAGLLLLSFDFFLINC